MILSEITETISRLASGGVFTDESKFDTQYVIATLNRFRALWIQQSYRNGNRFLNPVTYQKFYASYDEELNEQLENFPQGCAALFEMPQVISLDNRSDGLRFVGSFTNKSFDRIRSRDMLSSINTHRYIKNSSDKMRFLYDGGAGILEIYGNQMIRKVLVEALFSNPLAINTYNPEKDEYPLAEDDLSSVIDMMFRNETSIEAATLPDYKSDSIPNLNPTPQPRRR